MARFVALVVILLVTFSAAAEDVKLVLVVKQVNQQDQKPTPFSGVGKFEIFRDDVKYPNASCPGITKPDGRLTCDIPCVAKDTVAKTLRVVPPGKEHRVRGYVAPPSEEVEIQGCTLSPSAEREFVYVDSGVALASLIKLDGQFAQVIKVGDGGAVQYADTASAMAIFTKIGASQNGKSQLASFQAISAAIANAKEAQGDTKAADAASKYSIGISNVFLNQIAKDYVDPKTASNVRVTANKADYYTNLGKIEGGLESKIGRSTTQNILLNDVQILKGSPHDALGRGTIKGYIVK